MKELEEKIMAIFKDHQVTHGGLTLITKEIAALIEPLECLKSRINEAEQIIEILKGHIDDLQAKLAKRDELIEAQDKFIEHIKCDIDYDDGCTYCSECEIQISELRKEIEK